MAAPSRRCKATVWRIIDADKGEAESRRHRPAARTVPRRERLAEARSAHAPSADEHQRADHRAQLVMQKGPRRGCDANLGFRDWRDVQAIECPDRALRLAFRRPEGGEIVP